MRWIHAALVVALALMSGCDAGECERGETRCRDNWREYCDLRDDGEVSDPPVWHREDDCGEDVCKEVPGVEAFCALGEDVDPRCGGRSEAVCDGQQRVNCTQGYATTIADCTSGYCVKFDGGALCSPEPLPNEICPPGEYATACDGNTLLTCSHGYATTREDCSDENCVETSPYARCLDPRCPRLAGLARVCDGDVIVVCADGSYAHTEHCELEETCQMSGTQELPDAVCVPAG